MLNHQAGKLQVLNKTRSLSRVARYPIANKKLDNGKFTAAIAHMEGSTLITSPLNSIFFFSKISKIKIEPPKKDNMIALKRIPNSCSHLLNSSPKNIKLREPMAPAITGKSPMILR